MVVEDEEEAGVSWESAEEVVLEVGVFGGVGAGGCLEDVGEREWFPLGIYLGGIDVGEKGCLGTGAELWEVA